jgi:hypothetical protein
MKQSGYSNKILSVVLGVMTGIIIFLASFSLQINNTLLNNELQIEAAENLGFFENISGILETIAGKIHNTDGQTELALKNNITPGLVKSNIKSLINWLAGYEQMNNILSVLNLTRFILILLTIFSLLAFASVLAIMLFKSPFEIRAWIRCTSVTYAVLYPVSACLLHQVLHYGILRYGTAKFAGTFAIQASALEEPLTVYISYLTGFLPVGAAICGILLFIGVEAAILCICPKMPNDLSLLGFSRRKPSIKTLSPLVVALLLSAIAANMQIISARRGFTGTDFPHAIAFIGQSTGSISVTDARNHEVCFLNVIILDENSGMPVHRREIDLYPAGSSMQIATVYTNTEGSAGFLLEKGKYRIVFNADADACAGSLGTGDADAGSFGTSDVGANSSSPAMGGADTGNQVTGIPINIENPVSPGRIAFDFELSHAGRTDLFITIGNSKTGTIYIKDTAILNIP